MNLERQRSDLYSSPAMGTQVLWFSMLETGLALISLNLPPSWSLISRLSVKSVLQSIRRLLSLRSRISSRSDPALPFATKDHIYVNMEDGSSAASQNIELVPHAAIAEFDNKVECQRGVYSQHTTANVEGFINAERRMEQTESRIF